MARVKMLQSTPLNPIADRMRALTKRAGIFWAATAFLSGDVVADVIEGGLEASTRIRLLTGTFGRQTRRKTFERLLEIRQRVNSNLETRIWDCGRHRNLHAKLYLWRNGSHAVGWLGSANMTVGGLQAEGELIFEFRGAWDSPTIRTLRSAFNKEWQRSDPLDRTFLQSYREAPRSAPDMRLSSRPPRPSLRQTRRTGFFVTLVVSEFDEQSRVAKRIDKLMGGIPDPWMRHRLRRLMKVRRDDECVIISRQSGVVELGRVTGVKRDGRWHVFSYQPILPRDGTLAWNRETSKTLEKAGIRAPYPQGLRTQWLDQGRASHVKRALLALAREQRRG